MHLLTLYLRNFRNYKECVVEFQSGLNVIWGANAQGKTNLVEAIYLLMLGRSFRTSRSHDLFHWGGDGFYIEAHFMKHDVRQTLSCAMQGKEKRIMNNNTVCPSLVSLLGILPGVLMAPDDELIKGPPLMRRQFLDIQLSQSDPLYLHHLTRYTRALRQRNQLLRHNSTTSIGGWEEAMALAASYLVRKRRDAVAELAQFAHQIYPLISGETDPIALQYHTKAPDTEDENVIRAYYVKEYLTHRNRDLGASNTTVGPHRDEMKVHIGQQEARLFGSEGQKRTCVAALRLATWHRLKKHTQESPLMLIDDIGASLDDERRDRLIHYTKSLGQVFITSTHQPKSNGIQIECGGVRPGILEYST